MSELPKSRPGESRIWLWAFGYFAAYAPYALLTKALSNGRMPGIERVAGATILPVSTLVSALGMFAFLAATGLWRRAPQRRVLGVSFPFPRPLTLLSGACTAAIVVTTTLAYTFEGTSIVLMMLLMRGGVLVLAPLVDRASKRKVRWYSWVGLVLSAAALLDALAPGEQGLALGAIVDATVYLAAYFVRLRLMSQLAKGEADANTRFFVEEQIVATPLAVLAIAGFAALGTGTFSEALVVGFRDIPATSALPWIVIIGICSQGTGIFGALVLLDARENTFSVPVNRASSILAGVVATIALWLVLGGDAPDASELFGAGLVIAAIVVLAVGPRIDARRQLRPDV